MKHMAELLGVQKREKLTIIGSGGKTTLLWNLAGHYRKEAVLVGTTTKIFMPEAGFYHRFYQGDEIQGKKPEKGITLVGELGEKGKLGQIAPLVLASAAVGYDKVFLEGDGSAGLPLKGWEEYEPVVPEFTTATVGLILLQPIGSLATEEVVHRLPLFCKLTGLQPGKPIKMEHIVRAVTRPEGLMQKARGKKIILLNKIEKKQDWHLAKQFVEMLPKDFLPSLDRVVAGTARENKGEVLWCKE